MISFYIVGAVVFFLSGDSTCTATTTTHRREKKSMKNHRKYQDEQYDELPILDDIVLTDPDLTTLATAFQTANLNGTLSIEDNFTVFAPTNDAFASLNQTLLELLLTPSWRMHLVDLLIFHVTFPTVDRQLTKDFKDGQVLDMINGEQITVRKFKRGIELSSPYTPTSSIVEANILASNGALNKIDSVLLPGFFGVNVFALGDAFVDFTTLQELLELDGGKGREGLYTILAPDNGAFASMTDETLMELKNNTIELNFIMENHIIPGVFPSNTLVDGQKLTTLGGRNVTVSITESKISETGRIIRFNGVPAVQSDLLAMNGVAYRFESLVFDPDPASDVPSFVPSDVPSDYPSDIPTSIPSIFDVGEIDPDFTVLDELFDLTGLGDLEGEFTLLAPENNAWFALGNETLARLRNNIAVLDRLLRGHLIVGIYPPSDLINGANLPTLAGFNVTVPPTVARSLQFVAAQQSSFMFNEATSSDIYYAGNGIIYKIDEVLFDELTITLVPTPTPTISPIELDAVETNVPTETPVVEVTPEPTVGNTDAPTFTPTVQEPTIALCIDFDCDDGYILVSDAATIPGNDRATCCYFGGICAGAPVGAMCALGDISTSLISNPSFEEFSECPNAPEQISLSTGWIEGGEPQLYSSSFFVQSPTCNDSWYRNGATTGDVRANLIGSIPQNAADGNGFVGTSLEDGYYASFIGTCLNDPLTAGVEYTLTLNVASPADDYDYGGDTDGATDLICIPDCSLLPYGSCSFSGSEFEVLATGEPDGGLIGGGDWKAITFNFVPSTNCAAIVIGPNEDQTSQADVFGSYVLYDFINLQEGAAGMCNADGECVPAASSPTFPPTSSTTPPPSPSPVPSQFCTGNSSCDDANACTIDTCTELGCSYVPSIECGDNEACDPIDGLCKNTDTVRPCIAIIDESDNFANEQINELWREFRTNYPFRPFCLLIPNETSDDAFFFPTDPDFLNDDRTAMAYVNRDYGNPSLASDYLSECGYSNLAVSGIDYVGLFVDESGSMDRYTVRASLTVLFQGLEALDVTYCTVVNEFEDWITPFDTELAENCTSNIIIDFPERPTFSPTLSDTAAGSDLIPVRIDPEPIVDVNNTIANNSDLLESPGATKLTVAPTVKPQSMPKQGPAPQPMLVTPTKTPIALNIAVPAAPSLKVTSSPMLGTTLTPIDKSTSGPAMGPTPQPVKEPTNTPTVLVTKEPIAEPTATPTNEPTPEPTIEPTVEPTTEPTERPESTDQESSP